jgi:hypothetical protein
MGLVESRRRVSRPDWDHFSEMIWIGKNYNSFGDSRNLDWLK